MISLSGAELQAQCIRVIEEEFHGYAIKVIAASKSGVGDIICCISGRFYLFEVKAKNDTEKPLQRDNVNRVIEAGGCAAFIRSVEQLRQFIISGARSERYKQLTKNRFKL